MRIILTLFTLISFSLLSAQTFRAIGPLEGQHWSSEVEDPFDRLPERAKDNVTKQVWGLSKQAAGLMTRFRTNASRITIRYQVSDKEYGMNHMPSTGKSGVDLYAITSDGQEKWSAARRRFGDTIVYVFPDLDPNDPYHQMGREYRLYLPLYNKVEWMEIGVSEDAYFENLPVRPEKPIVVYGTSIAQGACASRPGMAWTALLGRKMDRPLINLGFSGNGLLDPAVLNLMSEIAAKVFVLDCLPNLVKRNWMKAGAKDSIEFIKLIVDAVKILKNEKPDIPVLLVEHAGYTEEGISIKRKKDYAPLNELQKLAYIDLKNSGYDGVYYLTKEEIGLSQDAMVDGTHPTDLGMKQYANAYESKLRTILHESKGNLSTTIPTIQYREPGNYDWEKRHLEILEMNQSNPPKQIFFANSIIHFWGGEPEATLARDSASWENVLKPAGLRNMAYGWDRVENVLWRVQHGELEDINPERILVMIGTNNMHLNTNAEIVSGIEMLVEAIKYRQPAAEIVLMGILPRRNHEERIGRINMDIAKLADQLDVKYDFIGSVFLNEKGKLREELFSDGLHPNKEGYQTMLPLLSKIVK
jgi:lysophospholipase L1-like esterase